MSYNYPYAGQPFFASPPPVFQRQMPLSKPAELPRGDLNSMAARQQDVPVSEPRNKRPVTVKFMSVEELMKNQQDEA